MNSPTHRIDHNSRYMEFCLESLEEKILMAGDVVARLTSGGDLKVLGDASDNSVQVSTIFPGRVTVTGLDGTTINGNAFENFDLSEFGGVLNDDVIISMLAMT